MLLGHNVVANRKAETRPFAGRLGGEERLKELALDLGWNANAVVADVDFNRIAQIRCRDPQSRLELRVASLLLAFGSGVEAIAEQVETDAGDVLRDKLDGSYGLGEISFECDVEARILSPATVIGEVQRLLDQAVEIDTATFAAAATRMLQHALDDAIGAASVLGDLFEIAGQHRDRLVNLSTLFVTECIDRWSGGFLQFVEQLDREVGEIVYEIERVLDLVGDPSGQLTERGHLLGLD